MKCDKLEVQKIGDLCFDFKMGKNIEPYYYRKSEVYKVIAEKDKEIAELTAEIQAANKQVENLINSVSSIMVAQYKVMDYKCVELNNQKRKRCLAMANGCKYLCAHYQFIEVYEKRDFFRKWMFRWLELADKFKVENK